MQTHENYQEILSVTQSFANPTNPFHHFIYGISCPRTYAEVRSLSYFAFTKDLAKELNWLSISILRYAAEISRFVEQSCAFQNAFLLGNYEQAERILKTIISNSGLSLWTMEKMFLLKEMSAGLEANKIFLTELLKDNHDDFLKFLAHYISMRSEINISPENYKINIHRAIESLKGDPAYDYLLYRLDSISVDLPTMATDISFYEGPSPICDRYLTFLALCQSCAVRGGQLREVMTETIQRLDGKIQDPRVACLLQLYEPGRQPQWNELSAKVLDVMDLYTIGNYRASASSSASLLLDDPSIYELYYVYLHSRGYLGLPFEQIFLTGSPAADLLELLDSVTRGEQGWKASIDTLLKGTMSFWRDPLAYGLHALYVEETQSDSANQAWNLALLNAMHVNPRFAQIFDETSKAEVFLDRLSTFAPNSSTIALMKEVAVTSHCAEEIELPSSVPDTRRLIYRAAFHESTGHPHLAITDLKPLMERIEREDIEGAYLLRDKVSGILFRCFLQTNDLEQCLEMVVRVFLRNPAWIRKFPIRELVDAIEQSRPPNIMRLPAYPILLSILHTKPRPIYVAFDNFLNSLGVSRPTQLFNIDNNLTQPQLNYFLWKVCTIDVLACSFRFSGTEDLENERIRICQYLSERVPTNLRLYSDEISSITSRSIIRKGIQQIAVSKIYVDEQGIRTVGYPLLEESFTRYRKMASFSTIDTLRMLDLQALQIYELHLDEQGEIVERPVSIRNLFNSETRVVHTAQFALFKELFLDIRDRFISSGEHGLDAYLSVRIRHGVLQNQIRSPFEASHLMAEKDTTTGEYLQNSYWISKLPDVPDLTSETIQKYLSTFSQKVDVVAQKLNKEMVQVRTERKNPEGLFDYTFSEDTLFSLFYSEFSKVTEFNLFFDGIFQVLWERTRENLEKIRTTIYGQLKNDISQALSDLEKKIRGLVEHQQAPELLREISRCQTRLQYELDNIAQWFTISSSNLLPQFSIRQLINICVQSINNIYPHKTVQPTVQLSDEVVFDGKYFPHFSDIARTLIDNILVHSGLTPGEMAIEISSKVQGGKLELHLKNRIAESVRESDPVSRLQSKHKSLGSSEISEVISREGGSGLLKVQKIMAVDLHRVESSLRFSYDTEGKFLVILTMELEGLQL